ncbi:HET-domain-containing protein [Plenodomus tracheiphilus IPT5]|uniref:HET-domain-containing protein n=1 Tax=Plenodomus tracheiphilus IPT5 TaxID=1408161 RepID=A0A6A7BDI0_9PLEO|nr:HET-domain-containing protein [Plenodomus tracheiphilus IPT5]
MVSVCASCKGLQKHLHGEQETETDVVQWVNTSLPGLRTSSGGCRACALLLNGILLHHDYFAGQKEEDVWITAESFTSKSGQSAQNHLSVEVRWKTQREQNRQDDEYEHDLSTGYPDLKLEFFTDGDGQSPFSAIGQGCNISENPLQDTGLSSAWRMINNCVSSHPRCKTRQSRHTTLPRRVLDLFTGEDSKSIRLHESEYVEAERRYEYGEYVALSHVWGLAKGLPQLTTSTLQAHKKSITWSTLPRILQEAVTLTRAMKIRWLWIDSLCLMQDETQEKLEESLQMDDIFGSAFLTIAATSATDSCTQPLFPIKKQPFKVQAKDNHGSPVKIYVREQPSHYSFKAPFDDGAHMNDWELPFNISEESNLHTPLLTRAWAYTERLLSPRVLHFTKSEMILECREGYQCECDRIDNTTYDSRTTDCIKQEFGRLLAETSSHLDTIGQGNGSTRVENMISQLASTSLANGSQALLQLREEALQLWSYIITEYTARNITYDSDRLIAIASIAKALSPTLQSGYIAGQWTFSTLALLWYPNDATQCRRTEVPNGQVPSWSWASIEGSPIFSDNTSAMDLACRVSFGPKGKRASAWSPIMGEPMDLSAAMAAEVTFHTTSTSPHAYHLARNGVTVDFTPDIVPLRDEDVIQDGETLVCILVSMTFRTSIVGLVLRALSSNTYRRIGRFECYECTPEEGMSEDAENLFEYWFPEVKDMAQLDSFPQRTFTVV